MSSNSELNFGNHYVKINAGELVSYQVAGYEFMHQKGNPGWRNVDTEMFPIIGPTNEAGFKVSTPRGKTVLDQHGLLREMDYVLTEKLGHKAVFKKKYLANTVVLNSKYPAKSSEERLSWPYDFEFEKSFLLTQNGLEIVFTISGEEGMPFMLGYHPAFMLHSKKAVISTVDKEISIPQVMAVGSRAMLVPDISSIILKDERELEIKTEGFHHFMLWTEVPNMVCIEPITFYPYAVAQVDLAEGFMHLKGEPVIFKVIMKPI